MTREVTYHRDASALLPYLIYSVYLSDIEMLTYILIKVMELRHRCTLGGLVIVVLPSSTPTVLLQPRTPRNDQQLQSNFQ